MSRIRHLLIGVLGASLLALGGCKHLVGDCHKPAAYAAAKEMPPLRIPVGLDGPDTREALKIPALNEPEVPRGAKDPCLEEPPAYVPPPPGSQPASATTPVTSAPADSSTSGRGRRSGSGRRR